MFSAHVCDVVQQVETFVQTSKNRLSASRQAFRVGFEEAAVLNAAQSGLYWMDVGGAPFHTQTTTLHRYTGMLSAMASNNFSHDQNDMFLDRDPTWFPLVLHFLRTGDALLPRDTEERGAVFREAQYYSLEGLCQAARKSAQIIVVGENWQLEMSHCPVEQAYLYDPLQGSCEHLVSPVSPVDTSTLPCCGWCAGGDGLLFAISKRYSSFECGGSVFSFCPVTYQWRPIAFSNPLQTNVNAAWAYHGRHLYGAGCTAEGTTSVQTLDVSTGQWEDLPQPSSPSRLDPCLCVVDNRLFVIGGLELESNSPTASVEEYLVLERRWVSVPDMPTAVTGASAVALNGKLLVIGGRDKNEVLSAVLEYNPVDRMWKSLPSLLTVRIRCAATVLRGDIIVIGGNETGSSSVERYNHLSHHWEVMPRLSQQLQNCAAVVSQA